MAYDHLEIEARWGTILGEENERMSKSRGNVVNPDDIGREYGADAFRLYEMSHGAARGREALADLADPGRKGFGPRGRERATPDGAAPAARMVSTHRAMLTTARYTEVAG